MRTLPIGDDRLGASTTGEELVVRSPYDGHEIDRMPACGAPEVERAVAHAIAVAILVIGVAYFERVERRFADII